MLFAFTPIVKADTLGYTKEQPLVFGIDMDYPPLEFVDDQGIPHGYDIEFTKVLMSRLNIPLSYSPNTWANISGDVLSGRVDLGMMVFSPYRKNLTNYSRAVFRLYYQIVYRENRDGERFDVRNLGGKSVAFMESRPIADTLSRIGAYVQIVENLPQAFKEVSAGRYDAVICFRYQTKYIMETYGFKNLRAEDMSLTPREYCYVSHNKKLIETINDELDKMESEGIVDKIYGDSIDTLGTHKIPLWVWYAMGSLVFFFLLFVIIQQFRYQRRLRREVERAQRSERLKTIFLSNVSHALRTPLNSVIGFSDMLRSDDGQLQNEERLEMLGLINSNGKQLLHFIEELLELSNIEGNGLLFQRKEVDIEKVMNEFADTVRPKLHEGVTLQVKGQVGKALMDMNLLRFVVIHLLDNSVEYTTQGGIVLKYHEERQGLYVEVRDTGMGIPEDLRENLFSLLTEEKASVQNTIPGLGLNICKAIVERTGGKIGAKSPKEGGTVVWFWIPRQITQ